MNKSEANATDTNIYDVINNVVRIVHTIVITPVVILVLLAAGYLAAVTFGPTGDAQPGTATEIKATLLSVWQSLIPIAQTALTAVSPIIVLVLLIGAVKWALPGGAVNAETVTKSIPSILALIVLVTICILPILGKDIPVVLTNIALVVVGYYFGKLNV